MAFGCEVGARVVTRLGAVAGLPRRSELGPAPAGDGRAAGAG
jgi:hypothetical protein